MTASALDRSSCSPAKAGAQLRNTAPCDFWAPAFAGERSGAHHEAR
ncbi:MAG TPA: hypothetical protein VF652_01775 [Allosphingosinicella sp.]